MNLIGLDVSLNSTAIAITVGKEIILFNYTTSKPNNKWIKRVSNKINFRFLEFKKDSNYSKGEIVKLLHYDNVTDQIVEDILSVINEKEETKINIEGYSYMSNTNSLIDIVTFTTLLRNKLYKKVSTDINIITPKSVKTQTSVKVYGYQPPPLSKKTGKPLKDPKITMNHDGVKGGDFKKKEMLAAMIDGRVYSPIFDFINENKDELLSFKDMPKPFDDIIDAIHIMRL